MVRVKNGAILGVTVGVLLAAVLILLNDLRPFSPDLNIALERTAFQLCPFYKAALLRYPSIPVLVVALSAVGNAAVYGVAGALLGAVGSVFKRASP